MMNEFQPLPEGIEKHPLGFYEVKNKPQEDELQTYYAKKYYQQEKGNYRSAYPEDEIQYIRFKIDQAFEKVVDIRGKGTGRLLDIGCGEGFTLAWFQQQNWQVTGLDYSAHGCEAMNPQCLPDVTVGDIYKNLDRLISHQQRFDIIWMTNVLEHVRDPLSLLKTCLSLVNPDSILVVRVPNDFSALQQHLLEHRKIRSPFWVAVPDHLSYFNRESLVKVMDATGWNTEALLADFPIDWFLFNDEANYNTDTHKGGAAHRARITLENLMAAQPASAVNSFYEKMAELGMGRQITGFYTRKT